MNERIARLRAQVAADRGALTRRLDELAATDVSGTTSEDAAYRAAWAAHHAYSALEAILERTARTLEGGLPDGADWHKELLSGAFLDIIGLRPAILSAPIAATLHELRGFRHFVRHAYDGDLNPELLTALQSRLRLVRGELDADLDRFDAFLEDLVAVAPG